IALSDRADHARNLDGRLNHVVDQVVDCPQLGIPATGRAFDFGPVPDLSFLADDARKALEFGRHLLIERDDLVEQHRQLDVAVGPVLGKPNGEVAAAELAQRGNEFTPALRELAGRCLNIYASLRKARERPFPTTLQRASQRVVPGQRRNFSPERMLRVVTEAQGDRTAATSLTTFYVRRPNTERMVGRQQ